MKVEQTLSSDFTGTNTTNTNNSHNRQNNFTHYSDIRVDQMDLDDKLFESDTSDASDDEHQVRTCTKFSIYIIECCSWVSLRNNVFTKSIIFYVRSGK